jgi:DNA excision repair protein ERCC-5
MRTVKHVDARRAQEMEDEILARALQQSESDPSNVIANKEVHNPVQQTVECLKETMLQIDSDAALAMQLQEAESSGQNDVIDFSARTNEDFSIDDEESDEIDWQDGDQNLGAGQEQDESVARYLHSDDETAHHENLVDVRKHSQARHGEDGSDDEIAWKDGDEKGKAASQTLENRRNGVSHEDHLVSQKTNGGQTTLHATQSPIEKKRQVSFMEGSDFDVAQVKDENSMALEHAQATAANLTNWAGRAFRQAIAQHAQQTGSPEKASHSNSKETKPTKDCNESNFDVQATAPSLKQAARPSVQHPFVTNESSRDRSAPSESANLNESASLCGLLEGGAASLQEQADILNAETRRHERDIDTVTDEMKSEVIQLIQLFGIPYVESPAEAEAQCVKLEDLGLVDGIVTEDSDVFVFGGKSIYRNIFDDQKYVEVYLAKDAERELALGRNEMVALAMLLGCDYSEGVKGVGIVNGMEVLQAFDVSEGVKEGLTKFRKWLDGFDPDDARKKKVESDDELSAERKFSVKHKSARTQWNAPANFPADNVINAYLKPVVDSSSDHFSWGVPDLGKLLVFCQRNMGWEQSDTRKLLEPVLQRLEDSSRQTRLESFFMKYDDNIQFANVKSKRLREVFESSRKQSSSGNESPKKRARSKP